MAIRIDSSELIYISKLLRSNCTQLNEVIQRIKRTLLRLDNSRLEFNYWMIIEERCNEALRIANKLSEDLQQMANFLERKAQLFEQVEEENSIAISNLGSKYANVLKPFTAGTLFGIIPFTRIAIPQKLGNLIGPKSSLPQANFPIAFNPRAFTPLAGPSLNAMRPFDASQIRNLISNYSKITTVASAFRWSDIFYHSLQLGDSINSLSGGRYPDFGYKIASIAIPFHQALIKNYSIGPIAIKPIMSFIANGEYNVRGLGKTIISEGDNLIPALPFAKAINVIFQSALGPALISTSSELGKFFNPEPYYREMLSHSETRAFQSLKKVDINNALKDVHSLAFDSLSFLYANTPQMLLYPKYKEEAAKNIQQDLSSLKADLDNFASGAMSLWEHFNSTGYVLAEATKNSMQDISYKFNDYGYSIQENIKANLENIAQMLKL